MFGVTIKSIYEEMARVKPLSQYLQSTIFFRERSRRFLWINQRAGKILYIFE